MDRDSLLLRACTRPAAWLLLLLCAGEASAALRCGSRLASEGMLAAEVLAICGEPDYRDVWSPPAGQPPGYLAPAEEWTYNRGSSQLLRILRFRNGRLERIDSEGYGFVPPQRPSCDQRALRPGVSKYRLLARCGEPLTRIADYLLIADPHPRVWDGRDLRDRYDAYQPVWREEWVYNFGANQLLRTVVLENGRILEVRTGRRGFDP